MAYHVGCNPYTNVIYAGTINKVGDKWTRKSDVTEECLTAAREHLLNIAKKEETPEVGYYWDLPDGRMIGLRVTVIDKEEAKNIKATTAE